MMADNCNANIILAEPFMSRKDKHPHLAYDNLLQILLGHKLTVDLQIFDNEASAEYKRFIKIKWNANYQLVPPNKHQINAYKRAICMFKAHFLAILAGVAQDFPRNLWDLLLPQTELTLNFLRKATLDPSISAWSYFHGSFNCDATPIGPLSCNIIAHKKTGKRHSWDFRGADIWNVGVALQHYWCRTIVTKHTHKRPKSQTQ